MLIVCFGQGLGNQMFQYAFYLALKKNYPNCNVMMDINHVIEKDHNGFELDRVFGIERKQAKYQDVVKLAGIYPKEFPHGKIFSKLMKISNVLHGPKESYIKPDDTCLYYKEVFELNPLKSYLFEGRWTDEKYFSSVQEEVKKSFTFQPELSEQNQKYKERMEETNSVSIHIRRGDFAANGFYLLPVAYYQDALKEIKKKEKNLELFIFTDDVELVKKEFYFEDPFTIVEGNTGNDSYVDMQLMASCKHNIIANSTFSFWGAFLNDNPDKIVVAPSRFNKLHEAGFYCREWTILDVLNYL